ncbi:MAG: hypothetical protein AB7V28_12010 [Arcobacteraceae bacterium]
MARKNKLKNTKYPSIKELEMADGSKNHIAIFSHNGTRYGERNLTKLFGVRSAKQAFEQLQEIKSELSKGIDVFGSKSEKVDDLVVAYLSKKDEGYRKTSEWTYKKHIQPVIGHLMINKVSKDHLEKIKKNMEDSKLAKSTIKKVRTILHPVFQEAYQNEVVRRNVVEQVSMGGDSVKPELTDRLNEPLIDAIRKIYNSALKQANNYNAMFLISIMCARRFGEILQLRYEDIVNGVVHVRAGTTKTFKDKNPETVAEKYPLPKEVLDLIGIGEGEIFKLYNRTYSDKYAQMIDLGTKLKLKPLAEKHPIRSHDNRNFLLSIQSKKFGIDFVGTACLSHTNKKADINARYHSIEFDDVVEVFEDYWEKLRGNVN